MNREWSQPRDLLAHFWLVACESPPGTRVVVPGGCLRRFVCGTRNIWPRDVIAIALLFTDLLGVDFLQQRRAENAQSVCLESGTRSGHKHMSVR